MKEKLKFLIPTGFAIISVIVISIAAMTTTITFEWAWAFIGGPILMFLYPLAGKIFKLKLPLSLEIVLCLHIFFAFYLGTGAHLYTIIPFYDLLLHGFFGIIGCIFAYLILVKTNGTQINTFGFLIFLLVFSMGCAALWEISEFFTDIITGGDCMHVKDAMEAGLNPIADTMEDMIITLIGVLFTYVLFFIDRHFGYRVCKILYHDFKQDQTL